MIPIIGFTAPPMSANDIGNEAIRILKKYQRSALFHPEAVSIEWLVEKVFSDHGFCLELKPDTYFTADVEAVTDFQKRIVYIRESTYNKLGEDDGRARFTLAHECAHVILHTEHLLQKLATAARAVDITQVPPYISPEWQANTFAAALLMPKQTFWSEYSAIMRDHQDGFFTGFEVHVLANTFKVSCIAVEKRIEALIKKKGLLMK
jgi:hypothetical protein